MGERIQRLHMQAFRGVPDKLTLDLRRGQSVLVFGDNATGKSTIADAIEWYFTGQIDYLTKEFRHEGLRNAASPADRQTVVEVDATGDLTGRISTETAPPDRVTSAAAQERYLLRGRELANFVDKTKGEKWKALAGILGLESVEAFRRDLQRARNDLRRARDDAQGVLAERAEALRSEGPVATEAAILAKTSEMCGELGVPPPASFTEALDESWRKERISDGNGAERHAQLRALNKELENIESIDLAPVGDWNDFIESEGGVPQSRIRMFKEAQRIVDVEEPGECPLCGQTVAPDVLRERILDALHDLKQTSELLEEAREKIGDMLARLERISERCVDARRRTADLELELAEPPSSPIDDVREQVDHLETVDLREVSEFAKSLERWRVDAAEQIGEVAQPLPEGRQAAMSALIELLLLAGHWSDQRDVAADLEAAADLAERVYARYAEELETHLDAVLERISKRVADIYGRLHPDEGFEAVSVGTVGHKGVELTVDFHGEQHRPPQRVLSESHMNSLGLALFLAMHDTYNEHLEFLVLDDVVNSFDIGHRGTLADLLASEYDHRQLIVLTHDHQFYARLARQTPSWKREEFVGWTYEDGPRTKDVGPEPHIGAAQDRLAEDDTVGAGQRARRALEEILLDACERLEVPLPFRRGTANEIRDATDLLNGLRRGLKKHAKGLKKDLEPLFKELEADLQAALNEEVHAGRGRSSRNEIAAAIERIEGLRSAWTCAECGTAIWLKGTPTSATCKCGARRFPPSSQLEGSG